MIKERNPGIAVLTVYLFQKLDALGLDDGYADTRSWIHEDLREKEMIFVPILKNDHFSLIYINTKEATVHYLDSIIGFRKTSKASKLMKQFIEKYYEEKGQTRTFRIRTWWQIPTQHNAVDCGVFICQYAERLARRAGLNFKQSDMPSMRWKMTWEILNSSLKEVITITEPATVTDVKGVHDSKQPSASTKKKVLRKEETAECEVRKAKINWPPRNSEEWVKLDTDLTMILRETGKNAEAKAELHPKIIYKVCLDRFGEVEQCVKRTGKPSRRNKKAVRLREEYLEAVLFLTL